jgi:CBS domain-containing protein
MKVKELLDKKGREVYSIHHDAIIYEAMQQMTERNISCLVVTGDKKEVVGIISERDILRCAYNSQTNFKGSIVQKVMTPQKGLVIAHEDDDIEALMDAMTEKRIRHIPIVDTKGALQGLISIGDLVKAQLSDKDYQIRYLSDYIIGSYPY